MCSKDSSLALTRSSEAFAQPSALACCWYGGAFLHPGFCWPQAHRPGGPAYSLTHRKTPIDFDGSLTAAVSKGRCTTAVKCRVVQGWLNAERWSKAIKRRPKFKKCLSRRASLVVSHGMWWKQHHLNSWNSAEQGTR